MDTAVPDLMDLLRIPAVSTQEAAVAAHIEKFMVSLGVPPEAIRYDRTCEQSEYGGATGNMIVRLPRRGDHPGASRLFMAHMDRVALTRDGRPRLVPAEGEKPSRIVNDNLESALGADNASGVTVLLHLARFLTTGDAPRPPVWMVFTVQEELGLVGIRGLDLGGLQPDPPEMGFNYDGSSPNNVIVAVIGTSRFFVDLYGKAAHAGINPQDGVSTAVAAAKALADLARDGWHGRIDRPEGKGCANVGVMSGGEMTNTVMDKMIVRGEVRSHDSAFRQKLLDLYRKTFEQAAADTRNAAGKSARIEWRLGPRYDSFALPEDAPVVRAAVTALKSRDIEPVLEVNDGGMDANWANAYGLPTVTLGTGQHGGHTVDEWIDVGEFLTACRVVEVLATQ